MLLARKLLDNFIDNLSDSQKTSVYTLAVNNMDAALSKMANLYESIYKDYPTGFVATFIHQHLKDKVFQIKMRSAA